VPDGHGKIVGHAHGELGEREPVGAASGGEICELLKPRSTGLGIEVIWREAHQSDETDSGDLVERSTALEDLCGQDPALGRLVGDVDGQETREFARGSGREGLGLGFGLECVNPMGHGSDVLDLVALQAPDEVPVHALEGPGLVTQLLGVGLAKVGLSGLIHRS
jgi:hypothetical protein